MASLGFIVLRVPMIMSWIRLCDLRVDRMARISRQAVSVKMSVCRHRPAMQSLLAMVAGGGIWRPESRAPWGW